MKILITGATGLIGKYLVKAFSERGDELFIVTRNAGSSRDKFPGINNIVEWDNFKFIE